jgi:hypothetical protein
VRQRAVAAALSAHRRARVRAAYGDVTAAHWRIAAVVCAERWTAIGARGESAASGGGSYRRIVRLLSPGNRFCNQVRRLQRLRNGSEPRRAVRYLDTRHRPEAPSNSNASIWTS